MKRSFTILTAAFALLAILAIPMGMKAAEGDVHDMNITQSTNLNNNASIPSVNIAAQAYPVKTVTINWRYNKTNTDPVTIEVLVGGTSWGIQTITGNTTADAVFNGESTIGAIVINFTNNTGSGTGHGTFYVNSVKLTEGASSGPTPTTYTVTYHANVTGINDIEETYNEGTTVTIADNTFSNPGYAFTEWNTEADGNGESYAPGDEIEDIDSDIDLYAQWEESSSTTYTYNFAGAENFYTDAALTTHPSSGSGNNVGTIYYGDGSTFVASGTNRYFSSASSGYFMLGKTGAQISLPTFDGYKITQVIVHTSGSVSGNVQVSIVSGSHTVSEAQKWATNSDFTYDIDADYQTSALSLNVTNNYNSQFTSITLVCEADVPSVVATPTISPADGTTFGNEGLSVTIACETPNTVIYYTVDGSTPDNSSTLYNGAIILTTTATIKAIAYDGTNYSNVATATYTYLDPNAPGTVNNPYTVAQARTAIDAGTGTQGVYATGIVSAIPTAWNSQYNNITFNFVDNVGDTDFLQAYRCTSGTGVDASEVAVGDSVVVYGNLTKYGSTYEFGQGCQLVSLTHPTVEVEAPVFGLAEGGYADTQTVTLTCATEGATIYYTTDGSTPDNNSTTYSDGITVSQTTTIKAIAYKNGNNSTVSTATYYILSNDNTLTVTEALGFDNYPVNNIFVQGVVSTAPTQAPTNNGELTYYISVDGEATNQLQVYKGKDLNNAAFDAQDDIQLGDIVTIFGNVKIYNNQKEFDQGNYLVTFERPVPPVEPTVTVTPSTINAPFEGADGTLAVTYEYLTDFDSFDIYFCDAEGNQLQNYPDWIEVEIQEENDVYSVYYVIDANDGEARTAYFKVYTFNQNGNDFEEVSAIVTVNQAQYVVDYAELPFEFDGGRDDIENTNGLTQEGLDSDYGSSPKLKFNSTGDWVILHFNARPGTLTFDIKNNSFSGGTFTIQTSEDGVTYTDLENYTEISGTQNEEFTNLSENVRYIKWIYTQKVNGNVALGNIALAEYVEPILVASITVNPDMVELDAEEHDGTLDLTYENLTVSSMDDFAIQYYDAEGEETSEPDWMEVLVAEQDPAEGEGYLVSYFMFENEGEARSAYFKVFALCDEDYVYSNLVTVNQAAPVAPPTGDNYELFSGELVEGDYLIVYDGDAMKNTVNNDRLQYETITVTDDVITTDNAAIVWHIAPSGEYWTIYSADANAYAASTGAKNKAQMLSDGNDDKALWTVSGNESYEFVNKQNTTNNVNANLRKNGSYGFACYNSQTGGTLSLYKKVESPVTETYTLTINGYGNNDGGWYLIASPVSTTPEQVTNMLTEETEVPYSFDLYRFNQVAAGGEWENYHQHSGDFNIVPGQGYLYANKGDVNNTPNEVTLTFTGTPYKGDGVIELVYSTDNENEEMWGWNLVGNPFNANATIEGDFYIMNEEGSGIVAAGANQKTIVPMQGIFVKATEEGQYVTFTPQSDDNSSNKSAVVMNLSQNRGGVIDRAIVRFGNDNTLPKFQLFENSTKLYIPQYGEDYAIVSAEAQGEMPVNFKASKNGTYTISFSTENVEMSYLHLIDNISGQDIDLLATSSYTFNAKSDDYASRFKLVFSTDNAINGESDDFAFISNGQIILNGVNNNATLQVVDMLGRVVSSQMVNGNSAHLAPVANGVYVLRLINGNDVKTQKIVVE